MSAHARASLLAGMLARSVSACLAVGLASCASAPAAIDVGGAGGAATQSGVVALLGSVADKALEATGIKMPAKPEAFPDGALPDRRIRWQLHASSSLNVTDSGQSLALVTRIYRLRSPDSFLRAPMDIFGDATRERHALGDDLVSTREVQLLPGQHHEATDKVPRDVPYLGIVALYRRPAAGRWRYAFRASDAELGGLSVGAHACALSVQMGEPIGLNVTSARSSAIACD